MSRICILIVNIIFFSIDAFLLTGFPSELIGISPDLDMDGATRQGCIWIATVGFLSTLSLFFIHHNTATQ
jgi:hypothetical protein